MLKRVKVLEFIVVTGEVIRFAVVVVVDFTFRFLFLALNKSPCDHSHDCFLIFYLKLKKKIK